MLPASVAGPFTEKVTGSSEAPPVAVSVITPAPKTTGVGGGKTMVCAPWLTTTESVTGVAADAVVSQPSLP